jgi:hypothetical protein
MRPILPHAAAVNHLQIAIEASEKIRCERASGKGGNARGANSASSR